MSILSLANALTTTIVHDLLPLGRALLPALLAFAAAALLFAFFKPLAIGVPRALWVALRPRHCPQEQAANARAESARILTRMARELETLQPTQAAELRNMAAGD